MAENIRLACRGWQHAHWQGSFYPEDLPEDWQLSYYSNEFDSVLIPADFWTADILQQEIDWCDQVNTGFAFYLEWPDSLQAAQWPQFYAQLEAMAAKLAAVLFAAAENQAAQALQQRLPMLPVYGPQHLWSPGSIAGPGAETPLAVLARPWRDLRELRSWLEAFTAQDVEARQAVLCTMPQPDSAQLLQARTLLHIMGL